MKIFILLFVMIVCGPAFAAEEPAVQKERANVGFNIFKTACFMMSPEASWGERTKFLDSEFQRHDAAKKELFLQFTKSKKGEVWGAVFPQGAYAIIIEDNQNCHVIAQKADDKTIHENMKSLKDEAEKNLKDVKIVYIPVDEAAQYHSSGFEIKDKSGKKVLTAAIVTTLANPPKDKPAALMTVVVSSDNK